MDHLMHTPGPGLHKARITRFRAALAAAPLVLVGDSDPHLRRTVTALLRRKGYRVRVHQSALELLQQLSHSRGDLDAPEFVVLGVLDGEREALEWLGAMDLAYEVPPAIVLVPPDAAGLRKAARAHGAALVIERPRALSVLSTAVAEAQPFEWAVGE